MLLPNEVLAEGSGTVVRDAEAAGVLLYDTVTASQLGTAATCPTPKHCSKPAGRAPEAEFPTAPLHTPFVGQNRYEKEPAAQVSVYEM
ncbi:MAG: hypothetical protein EOO65_02910 [Methanosarcinales archaeon]|nr:MAG: hypothetical protein EOO65_02910 [Methanosarcinales archaeon]